MSSNLLFILKQINTHTAKFIKKKTTWLQLFLLYDPLVYGFLYYLSAIVIVVYSYTYKDGIYSVYA